ncbi:Mu transposase domain-containing protein [Streptomyces sp. HUAS TT7]|uniref:Mu transposase domain-containing protein n=1 Tax=Streptomyces sp. HUAS TT7 TaxID=3447507 RepID=UPI003F65B0B4
MERADGYLETSFLPGRHFSGPNDFNLQLGEWLKVANRRQHRTLMAHPTERWEADRAGTIALPPVDPPSWWRFSIRLGRDHYVHVDTCDYSVDPAAIGRTVTVLCDNDQVLVLAAGGEIVAEHPRRWARHQTITDPDHAATGNVMRREVHRQQGSRRAAAAGSGPLVEVEQRKLGSYDRLFTVIDGGADDQREAG